MSRPATITVLGDAPVSIPVAANGGLVTAYCVQNVADLGPAVQTIRPVGGVNHIFLTAGSPYLCTAIGISSPGPQDIAPGMGVTAIPTYLNTGVVTASLPDSVKGGCKLTTTTPNVMVPPTNSDTGIVVGAQVGAGSNIAAIGGVQPAITSIQNLQSVVQVNTGGTATVLVTSGPVTLAAGQFVSVNGVSYNVSAAVVSAISFTVAGTVGAYIGPATVGSAFTVSGTVTAATGVNVTVGGSIQLSGPALTTSATQTVVFTPPARTFACATDGDYFEMDVGLYGPTGINQGTQPFNGYLRQPNPATGSFLVWDSETGGNPINTGLTNPLAPFGTQGRGVVRIYQKPKLMLTATQSRMCMSPPRLCASRPLALQRGLCLLALAATPHLGPVSGHEYLGAAAASLLMMTAAPVLAYKNATITLAQQPLAALVLASPATLVGGVIAAVLGGRCGLVLVARPSLLGHEFVAGAGRSALALLLLPKLDGSTDLGAHARFNAWGSGALVVEGRGLSVKDVAHDCLAVWNLRPGNGIADDVKERVMSDINAAMQVIYSRARHLDYFCLATRQVEVAAGTNSIAIPSGVQEVTGNVRLDDNNTPLWALQSMTEVEQFGPLYLGQPATTTGTPQGYFIDRRGQDEWDSVMMTLYVAPTPPVSTVVNIDLALEPPRYHWQDVAQATPLRLPHAYAESLLMPIVRQRAAGYKLFVNDSLRPAIEAQYHKAMGALGLADPAPPQAARTQTNDVEGRE